MHRRDAILAMLALGAAREAPAQRAGKLPRVGVLFLASPASTGASIEALRASLRDLGYVDGRTVEIEYRSAEGQAERLAGLARELVARKVDVILAGGGNESTLAARGATATIPIVMSGSFDAVRAGLVESLARPGGNITGFSVPTELAGKQLELMRELLPALARVAVLVRPDPAILARRQQAAAMAKDFLQLTLDFFEVKDADALAHTLAAVRATRPGALMVGPHPLFVHAKAQLLEFASAARIPAMYPLRDFVDAGGLMSYGVSVAELYRGAARYIDRILKGAKPAELPVEEPREFELVINRRTALALDIGIPQSLLLRASEVIE